jgi:hypothetical protein
MEFLGQGYKDIMAMPIGRRKRMCQEKDHFEEVKAARRRAAEAAAARKGGRR